MKPRAVDVSQGTSGAELRAALFLVGSVSEPGQQLGSEPADDTRPLTVAESPGE